MQRGHRARREPPEKQVRQVPKGRLAPLAHRVTKVLLGPLALRVHKETRELREQLVPRGPKGLPVLLVLRGRLAQQGLRVMLEKQVPLVHRV